MGLRQIGGWFGILLTGVSLFCGAGAPLRVAEEIASGEVSEVLEYAHRLDESGRRSLGRHGRVERLSGDQVAAVASRHKLTDRPPGAVAPGGYALPNGLCAPQRC